MKALLLLLVLISTSARNTTAQTVELIPPVMDAVLGYHYGHNSANTNYNTANWFGAMCQPGNLGGVNSSRGLILFDLSGYAPGTSIDQATLDLSGIGPVGEGDVAAIGSSGNNACLIRRVTTDWQDALVTWNTSPEVTDLNSVELPPSTGALQDLHGVDVTNLVQDMINHPDSAFGFLISLMVELPSAGLFFCGLGHSDPLQRPRLSVKIEPYTGTPDQCDPVLASLFPNPVEAGNVVRVHGPINGAMAELIDPQGRTIELLPVNSGTILIPGNLRTGTYTLCIFDNHGGPTNRGIPLVVERP